MRIAIAGTGYVGLVTGVCLANIGHNVICVDNDEEKIELLKNGKTPIYEKDLLELMNKNNDKLEYTTDYKYAYGQVELIFIGVGTPETADGTANLEYVYNVADQIVDSIKNNCIIVIKSTVPIGTNEKVEKYINQRLNFKYDVKVVSNPEFLSQGTAVNDTLYASRIVVGTNDEYAIKIMEKLYEPLTKSPYNVPYLLMDRKSAEMVKYASNDFLALKISYINEIANFCEKIGANIDNVTKGMKFDSRIGDKFLNAGIGYGGSCFPKDTKALYNMGKKHNLQLKTVGACIEVNESQKTKLFFKLKKYFNNNIYGKKVAVLGLTFKPNTDDLRDSPSIENIILLLEAGAIVNAYDPIVNDKCYDILKKKLKNSQLLDNFKYCSSIDSCISNVDCVLIFTEWDEIKKYNVENYEKLMLEPLIFDGRNCYDIEKFKGKKIKYFSIGR
ncbi:MAG: UDP-glucose/GDP-mannose dehydrogenase family protein [bacterium]|nr:UDP-glucose/GDP-mannose dehydrogenase family protein [bacterium]